MSKRGNAPAEKSDEPTSKEEAPRRPPTPPRPGADPVRTTTESGFVSAARQGEARSIAKDAIPTHRNLEIMPRRLLEGPERRGSPVRERGSIGTGSMGCQFCRRQAASGEGRS